jgi:hypothetical protein
MLRYQVFEIIFLYQPFAGIAFAFNKSLAYVTTKAPVIQIYDAYTWKGQGSVIGPSVASHLASAPDGKFYVPNEAGYSSMQKYF